MGPKFYESRELNGETESRKIPKLYYLLENKSFSSEGTHRIEHNS
jgi:hypothetical protein